MPPEQALGERVDERADVYALGALLYHALAGAPPFRGRSGAEVLVRVVTEKPQPLAERAPWVPPDLVAIVEQAMALTPANRYRTANELAIDLKKFQTGQLVGVHRYSAWQLARRWVRRNRAAVSVAAIAGVALGALGVASLVGVMREQARTEAQRIEAERSRRQAEDLMGFMLGDLTDKLEPVGKLPLLEAVARKALAYYAERPDSDDPTELRDRVTALRDIGEVLLKQGAFDDARRQLEAGLVIQQRLAAAAPHDRALARGLAALHEGLGELYRRQARLGDAMREFQAMRPHVEPPRSDEDRGYLATAFERIGWIEKERRNLDAALVALRHSRDLRAAMTRRDAATVLAISASHDSLGRILEIRGELAGALAEYRQSAALRQRLVEAEPEHTHAQFGLALAHDRIGAVLAETGDSAAALVAFEAAHALALRLTTRDETNLEWRDFLAMTKLRIGETFEARGDLAGALATYRDGETILLDLARRHDSNHDVQHHLAILHDKVGYRLRHAGDLDGALAKFVASKQLRERRSAREPANVQWRRDVAISLDGIAEVQLARGRLPEALASYRDTLALARAIAKLDPSNTDWQRDLALSHQNVADVLARQADFDGALAELRASVATFEALLATTPDHASNHRDLAFAQLKIGHALVAARRHREALAALASSRRTLETLIATDPANVSWRNDLADVLDTTAATARTLRDRDLERLTLQAALGNARSMAAARPRDAEIRTYVRSVERALAR